MKWLITGGHGMLATDLRRALVDSGEDVTNWDKDVLDITDPVAVRASVGSFDVVANCAAWVNAESAESNEADAFALNALGPSLLSAATAEIGIPIVHVSTDYVFGGGTTTPYPADADLAPLSAYGRTKAAGEWAIRAGNPRHYVFRTAWLYGRTGPCFPQTIARLAAERGALSVVDDQIGQPTWTMDVARLVRDAVLMGASPGVYNATSSGRTSWYEFARAVVASDGQDPGKISPVSSAEYPTKAPRPEFSALDHGSILSAGLEPIGEWRSRWEASADEILEPVRAAR